jgi:hypothetical protein
MIYFEVHMPESLYCDVLRRARGDLGDAMGRRRELLALLESTEKEIGRLKRLIGGVHSYVDASARRWQPKAVKKH